MIEIEIEIISPMSSRVFWLRGYVAILFLSFLFNVPIDQKVLLIDIVIATGGGGPWLWGTFRYFPLIWFDLIWFELIWCYFFWFVVDARMALESWLQMWCGWWDVHVCVCVVCACVYVSCVLVLNVLDVWAGQIFPSFSFALFPPRWLAFHASPHRECLVWLVSLCRGPWRNKQTRRQVQNIYEHIFLSIIRL